MRNYDFIRFCFNSEIRKKSIGCPNYWVHKLKGL